MSKVKVKDPKSTVLFKGAQMKRKLKVAPGMVKDEPAYDTWDCSGATGTVTPPTQVLVACYLKDQNTGTKYYANSINNNDPGPGEWTASNFPADLPSSTYYMYIEGDDESENSMGPLDCN
jgi:hypothetical protein